MKTTLPVLVVLGLGLAGCERISSSSFNPLNWFGSSENVAPVTETGELRPLTPAGSRTEVIDARSLAGSIVGMTIERTPDGAIVRATGTSTAPGQFNAQLVPAETANGTLTLTMRLENPANQAGKRVEPQQITAAYLLSNEDLAGLRIIQVQSASNTVSRRR